MSQPTERPAPETNNTPTDTPETPATGKVRTGGMRRWVFWLRAALAVSLLPVAFVLAAGVMMIDRDITAPSWIEERVADRVAQLLPGAQLDFGAITLRIGRDGHPRVRLIDTRLLDEGGLTLTRIPVVEGLISPRGVILRREILAQEVRLIGAEVNLRRASDGTVSFALGATADAVGRARNLPALLEQFDRLFERPALEALEVVQAEGLIVNFDDARAGRSWIVDGGRVSLDLRENRTVLRGDFALLAGRPDVTTVSLSYSSPRGARSAQIGLNIDNGVASDLASQSPALLWLAGIDAPLAADLRTSLDDDGALGPLSARLEFGAGVFQPNPGATPVPFAQASTYFQFDPVRDLIAFSQVSVLSDWGQLRGGGTAYLRSFANGLPQAILAQMQLQDVAVNPAGLYQTPPQLPALSIDLRARFDPFVLDIGELVARDGDSRTVAKGRIAATDAGWDIALDASTDRIAPARVTDFWPPAMRPGTRRWFANNIGDGLLEDVVVGLRIAPERAMQFALGFAFSDAEVRFMPTMPPITGADGFASIEENRFVVSLDEGQVLAPEGGLLGLDGSTMTVADMRQNPMPAVLDLRVESSVTAALSILNQPPFSYMDRADVPVSIAEGQAVTRGTISWPLMPRPAPDTVGFAMTSELTAVRSTGLVPGRTLVSPRLQVTASREGLNIAGPASVGDVSGLAAWDRRFGDPDRPGSTLLANVTLSQDFLDEFGIALPSDTVSGRAQGELAMRFGSGPPQFSLTSDLVGIRVAIPAVGWAKAPAAAGDLRIDGTLGEVPEITNLAISGGGLDASGRVSLNAAGTLSEARFAQVRLGDWLNAPITLQGRGEGAPLGVRIEGGFLDLRGARFGGGAGDSGPISIALDRLQIAEGIALSRFRGDFRSEGGFRGQFTASLNGGAPVSGAVAPRAGRSAVRLRSNDAGAVLAASGLMQTGIGGDFDLTLLPSAGAGEFDGTLAINDLRVRDAPTMAALLDAISVVGLLQQLDGQGLSFEDIDARFRLTPTQVIVAEASAVGPGLGISVDGTYTLASKAIDLQGVVSPFYLVNQIGSFLTRRGEGLIGFNFNIAGSTETPQVSVNPLSAFTPGMFREIFRRPAPDLSQ